MKSFKTFIEETKIKAAPTSDSVGNLAGSANKTRPLNKLDYDLGDLVRGFTSEDPINRRLEKAVVPAAMFKFGLGVKPASSQQELDWEKSNIARQEQKRAFEKEHKAQLQREKQKTSLPGTLDVYRHNKTDLLPVKEGISVPQGTTGKRKEWNPPMVGIRMASGKIEKHPPGKSGSSGGGNGGE